MKFVGVSAPAWTLLGKPKDPKPKPIEEGEIAIVDSDMLSKKHLYPRAPTTVIVTPEPRIRPESLEPEEPPQREAEDEKVRVTKPIPKKKRQPGQDRFHYQKPAPGPGPGSYQHDLNKKITNSLPNFSFGYRYNAEPIKKESVAIEELKKPTLPGIYHPIYKHQEFEKGVRFNKSEKDGLNLLTGAAAPGPGYYEVLKEMKVVSSKKGTFSKGARQPIYGGLAASANIESLYDTDVYTIARKAEQVKRAAELRQSGSLMKSASDGKLLKKISPAQLGETTPANFSQTEVKFRPGGPAWQFGSSARPDLNPPPPQLTKMENEKVKKFTERLRYESQALQAAEDRRIQRFLHATFTKAEKMPDLTTSQERKAKLNESDEMKNQLKLEREVRAQELLAQKAQAGHGPAFSFGGKHPLPGSLDREQVPGPGKYDFDHLYRLEYSNGKASKFGTSVRPPLLNTTGAKASEVVVLDEATRAKQIQWEQEKLYYAMRDQGPGIKFPKSKRRAMANNTDLDIEVGPGQYKLKSTIPQPQPHELARMIEADKVIL